VSDYYLNLMSRTGQRMTAVERRESVLKAALTEFAARGLYGTSTERVAQRAGISQPYLFRLFPTKNALFLALVERCNQQIAGAFTAAAADRVGEAALEAMGGAYEQLLRDRTLLLLLQMHAFAACDDPEIQTATRAGFRQLWLLVERVTGLPFERVTEFFARGMLRNVAAAMDAGAMAFLVKPFTKADLVPDRSPG
jgi:AcrR family transcriptional regulator